MEQVSFHLIMNTILAMQDVNLDIIKSHYVKSYTINMHEIKL